MNLVFIRHGQSLWNLENKFTGWVDIDLSEKGEVEAKTAGVTMIDYNFYPDSGSRRCESFPMIIPTCMKKKQC